MAEKVAAQRWRWRRSDGFSSAATAMAMTAQQWGWQLWQRQRMSIALLSLRVAAHLLLPMDALLSSPTDVRDVFCIFLLSLHIFNVGIPYRQTDTRQTTDDSLIISDRFRDKLSLHTYVAQPLLGRKSK
jgi:hypothetical protein